MTTKKTLVAHARPRILLAAFMQERIERLEAVGPKSTVHNFRSALNSFLRFLDGKELSMDELDGALMKEYEGWMEAKGLSENSSSFYLRHLRTLWYEAVGEGVVERGTENPFKGVFTGNKPTAKRAVPETCISLLERQVYLLPPKQAFALSMFLFAFYTRGMSFVDLAHLKKRDIQNGILTYTRRKTGKTLHIKVVPEMILVIKRYAAEVEDSPYLFPILDARQGGADYESALRLQNKRLCRIARVLGLSVKLTTHVARHTWATIARDKNVSVEVISQSLGHSSIQVTFIYLAELDNSVIDKANRIVLTRKKEQRAKVYESAS